MVWEGVGVGNMPLWPSERTQPPCPVEHDALSGRSSTRPRRVRIP